MNIYSMILKTTSSTTSFKSLKEGLSKVLWKGSRRYLRLYGSIFLSACILFTGCEKAPEEYVSPVTELRDSTPKCLIPEAPGTNVTGNEYVSIDESNASEGYICVTYLGDSSKVKLQITGPDYMTYTYDLYGNDMEVFPLSTGSGDYSIAVHEQIEGTQYSTVYSEDTSFEITNEMGAFLYPNQYCKFTPDSEVVAAASEIVSTAHDDLEVIDRVYDYITSTITYDTYKAETVESGYIPNVDEILNIRTGICLDYSAVMTSMLRSQQIPTRMEIGYAGNAYHAWLSAYVEEIGWINGIIQFDGTSWSLMDPTVAANSGDESLKKFIGDQDNVYMTKYTY